LTTSQSIGKRVYMKSILCERIREREVSNHIKALGVGIVHSVMVDQRLALVITTGLTDMFFVCSANQDLNRQPLHFTT
jgi:hypothetical protein